LEIALDFQRQVFLLAEPGAFGSKGQSIDLKARSKSDDPVRVSRTWMAEAARVR